MEVLRDSIAKTQFGCDFVLKSGNRKIKLLQITDMQIIDASQRRRPDRLRTDEINAWNPELIDKNFGNHTKSLIAQTKPDMIFITGDMVYGSFDDSGRVFKWFCDFMDSFGIPWAPVFGNHDNESAMGVDWQCSMLEKSKYCIFKRGDISGNSNYTVGICVGEKLVRVMHMLDTHGCLLDKGIYSDQLEFVKENCKRISELQGRCVPAFAVFHIPTDEYKAAEIAKGYATDEGDSYVIGVDVAAQDDDFGSKQMFFKKLSTASVPDFLDTVKKCNIQAVFAGHVHSVNTCISYEGVKWVFGLKTGQYDYHTPGQLGGTLVTLENEEFYIAHVPSLVRYAPFAGGSSVFEDFFAEDKYII